MTGSRSTPQETRMGALGVRPSPVKGPTSPHSPIPQAVQQQVSPAASVATAIDDEEKEELKLFVADFVARVTGRGIKVTVEAPQPTTLALLTMDPSLTKVILTCTPEYAQLIPIATIESIETGPGVSAHLGADVPPQNPFCLNLVNGSAVVVSCLSKQDMQQIVAALSLFRLIQPSAVTHLYRLQSPIGPGSPRHSSHQPEANSSPARVALSPATQLPSQGSPVAPKDIDNETILSPATATRKRTDSSPTRQRSSRRPTSSHHGASSRRRRPSREHDCFFRSSSQRRHQLGDSNRLRSETPSGKRSTRSRRQADEPADPACPASRSRPDVSASPSPVHSPALFEERQREFGHVDPGTGNRLRLLTERSPDEVVRHALPFEIHTMQPAKLPVAGINALPSSPRPSFQSTAPPVSGSKTNIDSSLLDRCCAPCQRGERAELVEISAPRRMAVTAGLPIGSPLDGCASPRPSSLTPRVLGPPLPPVLPVRRHGSPTRLRDYRSTSPFRAAASLGDSTSTPQTNPCGQVDYQPSGLRPLGSPRVLVSSALNACHSRVAPPEFSPRTYPASSAFTSISTTAASSQLAHDNRHCLVKHTNSLTSPGRRDGTAGENPRRRRRRVKEVPLDKTSPVWVASSFNANFFRRPPPLLAALPDSLDAVDEAATQLLRARIVVHAADDIERLNRLTVTSNVSPPNRRVPPIRNADSNSRDHGTIVSTMSHHHTDWLQAHSSQKGPGKGRRLHRLRSPSKRLPSNTALVKSDSLLMQPPVFSPTLLGHPPTSPRSPISAYSDMPDRLLLKFLRSAPGATANPKRDTFPNSDCLVDTALPLLGPPTSARSSPMPAVSVAPHQSIPSQFPSSRPSPKGPSHCFAGLAPRPHSGAPASSITAVYSELRRDTAVRHKDSRIPNEPASTCAGDAAAPPSQAAAFAEFVPPVFPVPSSATNPRQVSRDSHHTGFTAFFHQEGLSVATSSWIPHFDEDDSNDVLSLLHAQPLAADEPRTSKIRSALAVTGLSRTSPKESPDRPLKQPSSHSQLPASSREDTALVGEPGEGLTPRAQAAGTHRVAGRQEVVADADRDEPFDSVSQRKPVFSSCDELDLPMPSLGPDSVVLVADERPDKPCIGSLADLDEWQRGSLHASMTPLEKLRSSRLGVATPFAQAVMLRAHQSDTSAKMITRWKRSAV